MFLPLLLCAAPVPAPPAAIEPHHLVGEWDYSWGTMGEGSIVFAPNGWYVSRHSPRDGYTHIGRWELCPAGRVLTLSETTIADGWQTHVPQRYRVRLDTRAYPVITGACGETRVVFCSPKRGK